MMLCASSGMVGSIPMRFRHATATRGRDRGLPERPRNRLGTIVVKDGKDHVTGVRFVVKQSSK